MEKWAPVIGYYGFYSVSTLGGLRRDDTKTGAPFIVKKQKDKDGYEIYRLSCYGEAETLKIHRLVARAFLGFSPLQVNHKNGKKSDNRLKNLEYLTGLQNKKHASKMGLIARGERAGGAKLKTIEVKEIRKLYMGGGITQKRLAEMYKVGRKNITKIIQRQRWKHI
uniref:Putative homing endonuclease n=2 Tax=viral metagenome TaxID=1070528 RepID=A0A6M3KVH1_9ZZZZ